MGLFDLTSNNGQAPSMNGGLLNNPLFAIGLGLMSSNSPYAGQGIANGIMRGMQLRQNARSNAMQDRLMQIKLQQRQHQEEQQKQQEALRQRMAGMFTPQTLTPGSSQEFQNFDNPNFAPGVNGGLLSPDVNSQQWRQGMAGLLAQGGDIGNAMKLLPPGNGVSKASDLVQVPGPNGQTMWVPAGKAVGMPAYHKPDLTTLQQNLAASGLRPGTPEYQKAIQHYLNKSLVTVNQGAKLPNGYMWVDPNDPSKGAKKIAGVQNPANEGGRRALIMVGADSANKAINEMLPGAIDANGNWTGKGTVDTGLVADMNPPVPFMDSGVPWTRGRMIRSQMEDATQTKLRLETGAQANEAEVQNVLTRYLPSVFDDNKTRLDKLRRLHLFFTTSLQQTDPQLYKTLESRAKGQGQTDNSTPPPPAGFTVIP